VMKIGGCGWSSRTPHSGFQNRREVHESHIGKPCRAEFAKASRLRVALFCVQLAVALPGAISVIVPDDQKLVLYILAILGAVLLLVWWVLNGMYVRVRSAAQAARRGALLLGGLNQQLLPSEIQFLRDRFTVTDDKARECEAADYYATKLPHGAARLAEMLEESALYSEQLQRISANVMLGGLLLFAVAFLVISLAITPFVERDVVYIVLRVFLATLVFVMSADLLGAYRAHRLAAQEIKDIRHRLSTADAAEYPLPDVLLAFVDYNAAVESAPESVPFAYKWNTAKLNATWRAYQADREHARASR
jgi:hypothetical protein